jgi:hypothetical protein
MGIRTPGLVIANDALYQLSYTPEIRTLYGCAVPIMEPNATEASEDAVRQFLPSAAIAAGDPPGCCIAMEMLNRDQGPLRSI